MVDVIWLHTNLQFFTCVAFVQLALVWSECWDNEKQSQPVSRHTVLHYITLHHDTPCYNVVTMLQCCYTTHRVTTEIRTFETSHAPVPYLQFCSQPFGGGKCRLPLNLILYIFHFNLGFWLYNYDYVICEEKNNTIKMFFGRYGLVMHSTNWAPVDPLIVKFQ